MDRNTGKVLWQRRLGSGIIGNPITYKVDGKQYVSVWSGIGGWIGLPVTAGLDLSDKFGAIGATAMTKAANLRQDPDGRHALHVRRGELTGRVFDVDGTDAPGGNAGRVPRPGEGATGNEEPRSRVE